MNTERTFTTSYRHTFLVLLVATLLALSVVVGQQPFQTLTGIGSAAVAHACQGPSSGC